MMKQYVSIWSVFILLFLFAGCEKIIDFKGKQPPKKLVVTTMVGTNDDVSSLYISESSLIYEDDHEFEMPEEAELKIEVNGKECEIVSFDPFEYSGYVQCNFLADVKGGDVIRVTAGTDKHPAVTGEERVPPPPVITDVRTERFMHNEYDTHWMRALIRIKDDPAVSNYYRLLIKTYYGEDWGGDYTHYNIDQDLVMSSLSNQNVQDGDEDMNQMRIFPDDLFNGKEYTLNVYFEDPTYYGSHSENLKIAIEVQSLSESMYLYLRSLEISRNSDIFSEPVRIYSNIKGGYGIVGAYNSTQVVIKP